MDPLTIGKIALRMIVASGVAGVIGNAIKATTPKTLTTAQKVVTFVGYTAITAYVQDVSGTWCEKRLDDFFPKKEAKKKEEQKTVQE